MGNTDVFRDQHRELLAIAGELAGNLNLTIIKNESENVRSILSRLAGKLKVHLAMEDKSLYPALLRTSDAEVKALTRKFMDEMGGIAVVFTKYKDKYPGPSSLKSDPEGFITETKTIIAALKARIDKEDNQLYPLVDRLESLS